MYKLSLDKLDAKLVAVDERTKPVTMKLWSCLVRLQIEIVEYWWPTSLFQQPFEQ